MKKDSQDTLLCLKELRWAVGRTSQIFKKSVNHLLNRLRELVSFRDVFGEVSVGEEVSSFVYLLLDAEEERMQRFSVVTRETNYLRVLFCSFAGWCAPHISQVWSRVMKCVTCSAEGPRAQRERSWNGRRNWMTSHVQLATRISSGLPARCLPPLTLIRQPSFSLFVNFCTALKQATCKIFCLHMCHFASLWIVSLLASPCRHCAGFSRRALRSMVIMYACKSVVATLSNRRFW